MRIWRQRWGGVGLRDVLGLRPLGPSLRQCRAALAGDAWAPPSRWGISSLAILKPAVALPLWAGLWPSRRAIVTALPNRSPIDRELGYSVRVTTCRDFRGGRLTYDSHEGTDFAVPPGTVVTSAAPGVVVAVRTDMQRGGRKVVLDHGGGLITTSNHLARAEVVPGERVARAQPIGRSGMSGVDGLLFSPWLAPHVHFNTLLNGVPVDPWAAPGEVSLWRQHNDPIPAPPGPHPVPEALPPTHWDDAAVALGASSCRDPELAAALADPEARPARLAALRLFRHHAFARHPVLVAKPHPRRPLLDLPFRAEDCDGVVFGS